MKKLLLTTLLVAMAFVPIAAQQRTEAEAEAIAKAFMQNNGYNFNVTKSAKVNKVRTQNEAEITPYFIFNDTQKGGFVIVGGQEGMSDILAYSDEDCFDVDDMPPAAKMWLDIYAQSAIKAADFPEESKAEKRAAAKAFLKSNFALRQNVSPLLGEIKYNQGSPYNIMCPRITETTIQNGKKEVKTGYSVTGCTQTAQAMLMRYWKWPVRPKGSKTYTFDYETIINKDTGKKEYAQRTMSINFDEEPDYDWDNMLPRYESVTRTSDAALKARQDTAVARLMKHCGFSNGAGYGLGGTGAGLNISEMIKYFSYADDYISDSYSKYRSSGDDAYRAMLADELSQGRPIWAAGSEPSGGAHSYICDGYDLNALFHFNLGWNGSSNGWYEVAPVPQTPYGHGMWFHRHIHPEGRLTPTEPTRRIVLEVGYGDFNEQANNIKSALATLDTDKKFGESIICIATADTEDEAEAYLPGLSSIQGFIFDRHDTITARASQTAVTNAYESRVKVVAPAQIDVDAMYTSDSTMHVNVATQFPFSKSNADYRIAFVYTEDNVKIDGITYNSIARGSYPGKDGYKDCLPSEIEYDVQYIYESEIPIPASITETNNTTLVVMLIDGKNGEIVNANTVDLKQINTWKVNQKPAFYGEGKILADSSVVTTYDFDEEKSRMAFPVRINNPWYEGMPVEVVAEVIELAENTGIQLGETANATSQSYKLAANAVDSTMMLYLNISDKYQSSKSAVKLSINYNGNKVAEQIVNFDFMESVAGINPYTVRVKGTLGNIIPQAVRDTMTIITLGGHICGNDIIYLRDSLNVKVIDMSKARIVEGPGAYNSNYTTTDNAIGTRLFQSFDAHKIILPESATIIDNYAFNLDKKLSRVVIGQNVTTIGNSAFNGCVVMERVTIPASVTEIGRNAFKGCPLVCVICEGETPATLSSKVFDGADLANATLVVPTEAAIASYKAAKQWKDFGNIITYDNYLTSIAPVTEEAGVSVKDGKIIVAADAEVAIYTFTGKLAAAGAAGEYALPAGNYIVKVGNKAVKVRL